MGGNKMAGSMTEAMLKVGLITPKKAGAIEAQKRADEIPRGVCQHCGRLLETFIEDGVPMIPAHTLEAKNKKNSSLCSGSNLPPEK